MRKWLTQPTFSALEPRFMAITPAYDMDIDTLFGLRDLFQEQAEEVDDQPAQVFAGDDVIVRNAAGDLSATELSSLSVRGWIRGTHMSIYFAAPAPFVGGTDGGDSPGPIADLVTEFLDVEAVRRRQWQRMLLPIPWIVGGAFGAAGIAMWVLWSVQSLSLPLVLMLVATAVIGLALIELARLRSFIRLRLSRFSYGHRVLPVTRRDARLQRAVRNEAFRQGIWTVVITAVATTALAVAAWLIFGKPLT